MARPLDLRQRQELAEFVNALFAAADYPSTAEWARDSDYPAPNLSELRNAKAGVDGYNLLRLKTPVESWFNWRKARNMRLITLLIAAVALTVTVAAFAAGPPTPWTTKDMKTAIRAISYPKPHPVKLSCTGQGAADSVGRFASFRCAATYRHHVRKRFVIAGRGEGGWLCAGKTPSPCALLRHGFVTTAAMNGDGSLTAAADLAARGYLVNHDQFPYQVVHFCQQTGASSWSCPFTVNGAAVTVAVSLKAAKGGYVLTAASQ